MNSRIPKPSLKLWRAGPIIFLWSIMCYNTGTSAFFDNAREKVKRVYRCSCEETRTAYEAVKKYKKPIIGVVAYLAFEGFGYSQGWDTPLRRLLTPKKRLDDSIKQHQKLKIRCESLEKELEKEKERMEKEKERIVFEKQQQSLMEELEKFMSDK